MNLNNFSSAAPETNTGSKNLLTEDVEIEGTIRFKNELIFDGSLKGEIVSSEGMLTLGKNAHIEGDVHAKTVKVHGTVKGNITVTEICELKAGSELTGDLRASRTLIEEGATFVGKSEVTPSRPPTRDSSRSTPSTSNAPSSPSSSSRNTAPIQNNPAASNDPARQRSQPQTA